MPELPEVETVRRGLERTVIGKQIAAVEVRAAKLFVADPALIQHVLVGSRMIAVERRAKVLLLELSSGWVLAIHLKMTGQLVVKQREARNSKPETRNKLEISDSKIQLLDSAKLAGFVGGHPEKVYEQPLPHKHTHVIITFHDGTVLYFNDLRKFGWMRLLRSNSNDEFRMTNDESIPKYESTKRKIPTVDAFIDSLNLGPEPLSDDFTLDYFTKLIEKRSVPIKQLLLEQQGISGIGNIYADEALFRAGVHPRRLASSLLRLERKQLHQAIRDVLELGIKHGGTSKNTYRNIEGTPGDMQNHLLVYGREGLPCSVCQTAIRRIKLGQRSAHFCPSCQSNLQ